MSLIERALLKSRMTDPRKDQSRETPPPVEELLSPRPTPEDIPAVHSDLPVLEVNQAFLRSKGLIAPDDQERQQRAEYRVIKRGLLSELNKPDATRMVLISSALEGEGKSFSSIHLAMSLAMEPDHSVLLVDADVIRPKLTRIFGLADQDGIMDAVSDPSKDIRRMIVPTSIERLSILPAGRPNDNATEYFASARMRQLLRQLLEVPNRIVVVDSLPLLLTTEARALASIAGMVLLVVRAESTPQSAVLQAIESLGEGINVKLMLNAVVRTKFMDYMGLGYGYRYDRPEGKQ